MPQTATRLLALVFFVLAHTAQGQPIPVPLGPVANDVPDRPPVRRPWTRDITTYYRMGWQNLPVGPLNDELARNGYSPLTGRLRSIGLGVQMKITNLPLFLHTEANLGVGTNLSDGANGRVGLSASMFRLGMGYRLWQKSSFQLIPHLGVMSMPIKLRVSNRLTTLPGLTEVLNNPGASQTSQLITTAGAIDLGLTANYKFSIQRLYDDCTNSERALVLALDGGYRIGSKAEFLTETNPARRVSFGSSGWYLGIRVGAALRTDRAKNSSL